MHAEAKASELGLSVPEGPASQAQAVEIASWRFHRERFVSLRCFDDREVVRRWARRRGAQVDTALNRLDRPGSGNGQDFRQQGTSSGDGTSNELGLVLLADGQRGLELRALGSLILDQPDFARAGEAAAHRFSFRSGRLVLLLLGLNSSDGSREMDACY